MAFVDHGKFEAMKTPIGRRALHLQDIVVEHCGRNKNVKNGTFATAHFCV